MHPASPARPSPFQTPKKAPVGAGREEETQWLLTPPPGPAPSGRSPDFSVSKLLGNTQPSREFTQYRNKVRSDFREILGMLEDAQLRLLLAVVTLENLTPEISCIFFYYFIEILRFSFFDVNSVFVFASLGFLISLAILNFEFIESSFENFYKVTSFLLAVACFLNLR